MVGFVRGKQRSFGVSRRIQDFCLPGGWSFDTNPNPDLDPITLNVIQGLRPHSALDNPEPYACRGRFGVYGILIA